MATTVMTDQVGVRAGIGGGALFLITAAMVAGRLTGEYGVGLLLVVTTLFSCWLDRPHALLLGIAGWAFATGFAVNTLGVLTFAPLDLVRLAIFLLIAAVTSRPRRPA